MRVLGDDHMDVYVKGAPEKVASLCHPDTGNCHSAVVVEVVVVVVVVIGAAAAVG